MALLEQAEGIRRGTVRLFHAGLMPAEQRTARGEAPSASTTPANRSAARLRRAVEFARELPGMIAQRAEQELRHGLGTTLIAGRASGCRRLSNGRKPGLAKADIPSASLRGREGWQGKRSGSSCNGLASFRHAGVALQIIPAAGRSKRRAESQSPPPVRSER